MIIAHVLSSFLVGGQERVALDLARGQRARGHEVLAISLAGGPEGPLAADFAAAGVSVHTVAKVGPGVDPTLPVRLAALLRRRHVDVVHTHNPQPLIYGGLAGRMVGAAVVQTRHGVAYHSDRQVWLARQAGRLADAYVAVSKELETTLRHMGACGDTPVQVIENGIDLTQFQPDKHTRDELRRELGIPTQAFVMGTVSRLIRSKNTEGLIRAAFPMLGDERRLIVVGDGPEAAHLSQMVASHDKGKYVHLLGVRADVPRLLRTMDLFCLFSQTEGHPLVVLEAMATGVPVVATRVGGIPSIVEDGSTGFLVAPDDEEALGAKLAELAGDAQRRVEVAWRAREVARERYSCDRMVDDYLALYARCMGTGWTDKQGEPSCSVSRSSA